MARTALIMPTGESDWKMFRPISTPTAPWLTALWANSRASSLRRLLAAGDDDRNRTAFDQLVEIITVVSFDDMGAELGGDAAG